MRYSYPALKPEQLADVVQTDKILVIKSRDKSLNGHRKADADVTSVDNIDDVRSSLEGFDARNSYVITSAAFFPDILMFDCVTCYQDKVTGIKLRVPYPIEWLTLDEGFERPLPKRLLVDTGSPITLVFLKKEHWDVLTSPIELDEIKGLATRKRPATGEIWASGCKLNDLPAVYEYESELGRYFRGQFEGCEGLLGMDVLQNCIVTLAKGKIVLQKDG